MLSVEGSSTHDNGLVLHSHTIPYTEPASERLSSENTSSDDDYWICPQVPQQVSDAVAEQIRSSILPRFDGDSLTEIMITQKGVVVVSAIHMLPVALIELHGTPMMGLWVNSSVTAIVIGIPQQPSGAGCELGFRVVIVDISQLDNPIRGHRELPFVPLSVTCDRNSLYFAHASGITMLTLPPNLNDLSIQELLHLEMVAPDVTSPICVASSPSSNVVAVSGSSGELVLSTLNDSVFLPSAPSQLIVLSDTLIAALCDESLVLVAVDQQKLLIRSSLTLPSVISDMVHVPTKTQLWSISRDFSGFSPHHFLGQVRAYRIIAAAVDQATRTIFIFRIRLADTPQGSIQVLARLAVQLPGLSPIAAVPICGSDTGVLLSVLPQSLRDPTLVWADPSQTDSTEQASIFCPFLMQPARTPISRGLSLSHRSRLLWEIEPSVPVLVQGGSIRAIARLDPTWRIVGGQTDRAQSSVYVAANYHGRFQATVTTTISSLDLEAVHFVPLTAFLEVPLLPLAASGSGREPKPTLVVDASNGIDQLDMNTVQSYDPEAAAASARVLLALPAGELCGIATDTSLRRRRWSAGLTASNGNYIVTAGYCDQGELNQISFIVPFVPVHTVGLVGTEKLYCSRLSLIAADGAQMLIVELDSLNNTATGTLLPIFSAAPYQLDPGRLFSRQRLWPHVPLKLGSRRYVLPPLVNCDKIPENARGLTGVQVDTLIRSDYIVPGTVQVAQLKRLFARPLTEEFGPLDNYNSAALAAFSLCTAPAGLADPELLTALAVSSGQAAEMARAPLFHDPRTALRAWVPAWAPLTALSPLLDIWARQAFACSHDPLDAAIFYVINNRVQALSSAFRACGNERVAAFLHAGFDTEQQRATAERNAYALMQKHRLQPAAAFFVLARDIDAALNILLRDRMSALLAVLIVRMVGRGELAGVTTPMTEDEVLQSIVDRVYRPALDTGPVQPAPLVPFICKANREFPAAALSLLPRTPGWLSRSPFLALALEAIANSGAAQSLQRESVLLSALLVAYNVSAAAACLHWHAPDLTLDFAQKARDAVRRLTQEQITVTAAPKTTEALPSIDLGLDDDLMAALGGLLGPSPAPPSVPEPEEVPTPDPETEEQPPELELTALSALQFSAEAYLLARDPSSIPPSNAAALLFYAASLQLTGYDEFAPTANVKLGQLCTEYSRRLMGDESDPAALVEAQALQRCADSLHERAQQAVTLIVFESTTPQARFDQRGCLVSEQQTVHVPTGISHFTNSLSSVIRELSRKPVDFAKVENALQSFVHLLGAEEPSNVCGDSPCVGELEADSDLEALLVAVARSMALHTILGVMRRESVLDANTSHDLVQLSISVVYNHIARVYDSVLLVQPLPHLPITVLETLAAAGSRGCRPLAFVLSRIADTSYSALASVLHTIAALDTAESFPLQLLTLRLTAVIAEPQSVPLSRLLPGSLTYGRAGAVSTLPYPPFMVAPLTANTLIFAGKTQKYRSALFCMDFGSSSNATPEAGYPDFCHLLTPLLFSTHRTELQKKVHNPTHYVAAIASRPRLFHPGSQITPQFALVSADGTLALGQLSSPTLTCLRYDGPRYTQLVWDNSGIRLAAVSQHGHITIYRLTTGPTMSAHLVADARLSHRLSKPVCTAFLSPLCLLVVHHGGSSLSLLSLVPWLAGQPMSVFQVNSPKPFISNTVSFVPRAQTPTASCFGGWLVGACDQQQPETMTQHCSSSLLCVAIDTVTSTSLDTAIMIPPPKLVNAGQIISTASCQTVNNIVLVSSKTAVFIWNIATGAVIQLFSHPATHMALFLAYSTTAIVSVIESSGSVDRCVVDLSQV